LAGAPTVFKWQGRELLAAVTQNGRVILSDARSHGEALFATEPKYTGGSLATWEDAGGTRWIYAASKGNVTAFKMNSNESHPELVQVWVSRNLSAPLAPAIVNGMIFVLSSGEFTGPAKTIKERISKSTHATLYALDAVTGKELYSSGDTVTSFTHSSGLAVANGHVCFGTFDNTLYCFGIPTDI
jgi:outer membrane protein assembly factor BamB